MQVSHKLFFEKPGIKLKKRSTFQVMTQIPRTSSQHKSQLILACFPQFSF